MAYRDPVLAKLMEVLEANTKFKTYQIGMPVKSVPNSALPLLYLWSPATRSQEYTMGGLHKFKKDITIGVVTYWSTQAPSKIESYTNTLDELLEKRDDDYTLTGGILKIIQDNKELDDGVDIAIEDTPVITINKDIVDVDGILSVEGRITFTVEVLKQV